MIKFEWFVSIKKKREKLSGLTQPQSLPIHSNLYR